MQVLYFCTGCGLFDVCPIYAGYVRVGSFYMNGAYAIIPDACAVNVLNPIYIRVASYMFPLDVRNASASSTMRALLTLCVRFEISPGYPIAAAIRFHPVLSARLPMKIRYAVPMHTTLVRSIFAKFRHFWPFCERTKTERVNLEILLVWRVRCANVLYPYFSGTGP